MKPLVFFNGVLQHSHFFVSIKQEPGFDQLRVSLNPNLGQVLADLVDAGRSPKPFRIDVITEDDQGRCNQCRWSVRAVRWEWPDPDELRYEWSCLVDREKED